MAFFEKTTEQATPQQIAVMQDEIQRLKRAVEELSVLNELARAIGVSSNSQEVIGTIIRRSLRAVDAEQGVISLTSEEASDTNKTLIRTMQSSSQHEQLHLNNALLGWMHLNKKPLLLNSPRTDSRFQGIHWDDSIRTLLCVPLMVKSELRGVLAVYNKKATEGFSQEDQRLLGIIAAQSAQVIENARLLEQERSLLAVQEEIRLAANIQNQLLPKQQPAVPCYEIYGKSIPARVVGGDYFDFITVDDSRLAVCLGDVTGKGLPASLLMANVQATLRGQALLKLSPEDTLNNANKLLYASTPSDKFVTLFYGILDFSNHQLLFANAGHDPPFHFQQKSGIHRLRNGGLICGALEGVTYTQDTIGIEPGDVVLIYTDGISEAMNLNAQFFGEKMIEQILTEHAAQSAAEIADAVIAAVKEFAGKAPQSDDITILVVKRIG